MDLSGISHLIPSKVAEEDPDAWWRKTDITLDRNFGKPGNQYTGRSYPVKGNYTTAYQRLSTTLARTGTRAELNRAQYYERPSERKRRLRSHRWRRRFQEEVSGASEGRLRAGGQALS
jgi:ribosomal protein S21